MVNGSFTTCSICQPESGGVDWEIRAKEAVIEQDEYLEAKWASFWVRGLPSPPVPYLVYPIGPRRTGFLIPKIGTGSLRIGKKFIDLKVLDIFIGIDKIFIIPEKGTKKRREGKK